MRRAPLAAFAFAFALYLNLGIIVSHSPPAGIDLAGRALAGEAPGLAFVFTASCYLPVVLVFAALVGLLALRSPAWRPRALFAVVVPLAGWPISDLFKNVFARARPEYWVRIHETSYSYASGHAMFAVLIYGLWAWYVAKSTLPQGVRIAGSSVLALWACGVLWSRLALGAHYVTDLIGGVLLGIALLGLGTMVARIVANRSVTLSEAHAVRGVEAPPNSRR